MQAARSSIVRLVAGASFLLCALTASPALAGPVAGSARTVSLNETGHLRLTSKRGFVLNEEGTASGAIKGKIYLHLKIASTNHVTAEVSIYPNGGSLTGRASANYSVVGPTASFSGTMSIVRGTGSYRKASGTGLGFSGTIGRTNDAVTVHLTGNLSV